MVQANLKFIRKLGMTLNCWFPSSASVYLHVPLYRGGSRSQDFLHSRQALFQLSYILQLRDLVIIAVVLPQDLLQACAASHTHSCPSHTHSCTHYLVFRSSFFSLPCFLSSLTYPCLSSQPINGTLEVPSLRASIGHLPEFVICFLRISKMEARRVLTSWFRGLEVITCFYFV